MVVGDKIMLARVLMKKGAHGAVASPPQRASDLHLEGALKLRSMAREIVVRAGEVLCIPPHMPHEAWALEDTVDLDVFRSPARRLAEQDRRLLRHGR